MSSPVADPAPPRVTFRDVFAIGEYRAVWTAQLLSILGDQLAVVALTWLVYRASSSPLLAALTYSISFLPWLIGGPLLAGLADRLPRREVMVACDVIRTGTLLIMALPWTPLWGRCLLLFATELLAPPFMAARAAVLPDVLPGDRYVVGTAIGNITNLMGQVAGFAVGGSLVAVVGGEPALFLDALTFVASAAILATGLRHRPAAREEKVHAAGAIADFLAGARLVLGRPRLRVLAGLGVLSAFSVAPEALAVPYAGHSGGDAAAAGLLLASGPAGAMVGSAAFSRWVSPQRRLALMGPLAIAAHAVLLGYLVQPDLVGAMALFAISGLGTCYMLAANAAFVAAVPSGHRAQAFGLVQSAMTVGQGTAIILAGLLAERAQLGTVIALVGAAGVAFAVILDVGWRRCQRVGDGA